MASLGGLEALLGGLDDRVKKTLTELLRALVPNLRFGPVDVPKAENFLAYKVTSTTAVSTSEFSVLHGMGSTPYLAVPMMDLTAIGAGLPVVKVSRAADNMRVYLKAEPGSTNLPFTLLLE